MSSDQNSLISSRNSLRGILDNTLVHNKADVNVFSFGHLNEANLYKRENTIDEDQKKVYWPHSSTKRSVSLHRVGVEAAAGSSTNQNNVLPTRTTILRNSTMRNTLREFSIDTPLQVPRPPTKQRENVSRFPVQIHSDTSADSIKQDYIDDGVLIEQIPFFGSNLKNSKNSYLPVDHTAITKADQYAQMKNYENNTMKDSFTNDNKHLIIDNIVQCERIVKKGLSALDNPEQASFMRLQVYADGFQCIGQLSTTFGYLLTDIKLKYDAYVERLLDDNSTGGHRRLVEQISDSMTDGPDQPIDKMHTEIASSRRVLDEISDTANASLANNKRLKEELVQEYTYEEELENEPKPRLIMNRKTKSIPNIQNFSEKVESLRIQILALHTETVLLKKELRMNYEPVSVTAPLQRCVKDTEVQCQKLSFTRDNLKTECKNNNDILLEILESMDIPDVDSRNIWSVIEGDLNICDLDIEKTEQEKWCWYIS